MAEAETTCGVMTARFCHWETREKLRSKSWVLKQAHFSYSTALIVSNFFPAHQISLLKCKSVSTAPPTAVFLRSPHAQRSFRPERWHSFAHYINSRLCLHPGLSGLVAGGWNRIQLMWQEERKSEREEKREREEAKGLLGEGVGDLGQKDSLQASGVGCGAGRGGCWGWSSLSHVLRCPAVWMAVG